MKNVIKLLTETKNKRARTTNDKRSVVQSIVLPHHYHLLMQKEEKPSDRAVAAALGLPPATYIDIVKAVMHKLHYWNLVKMIKRLSILKF